MKKWAVAVVLLYIGAFMIITPAYANSDRKEVILHMKNFSLQKQYADAYAERGMLVQAYTHFPYIHVLTNTNEQHAMRNDRNILLSAEIPNIEPRGQASVEPKPLIEKQINNWGYDALKVKRWHDQGITGKDVKIGVFDTGIAPHDDLVIKGGQSFSGGKKDDVSNTTDVSGNGTAVAGIIGSKNNAIGVVGIAPDADIYALKGGLNELAAALDWAISEQIDIINISSVLNALASDATSERKSQYNQFVNLLEQAINTAATKNVLIVAAAGYSGAKITAPAQFEAVISVGAVVYDSEGAVEDDKWKRLVNSSFGPELDVVAPFDGYTTSKESNAYVYRFGTNIAAPYVTGMLALMKQKFPELTVPELSYFLQKGTLDLGDEGRDHQFGHGLIQADSIELQIRAAKIVEYFQKHVGKNPSQDQFNALVVKDISLTQLEEEIKKLAPKPEAPKPEEPKTEAPKPEAPKTEAPKADVPKADVPKPEAPKTEAPKPEAPKTEAPKADVPNPEAPKTEAPKPEAPKTEAPKADVPKPEAPKTEAPKADVPKPQAPKNVRSIVTNSEIVLYWDTVEKASAYEVRNNGTVIGQPDRASYTIKGLNAATQYTIEIASITNDAKSDSTQHKATTLTTDRKSPTQQAGVLLCFPSGQAFSAHPSSGANGEKTIGNSNASSVTTPQKVSNNTVATQSLDPSKSYTLSKINTINDIQVPIGTEFTSIILPSQVGVTLTSSGKETKYFLDVQWGSFGYSKDAVGSKTIRGNFVNVPTNIATQNMQPTLAIHVIGGNVVALPEVDDVRVRKGTPWNSLTLPSKLKVEVQQGTTKGFLDVSIKWNSPDYDDTKAGQYVAYGTLDPLPDGVNNPNNYQITLDLFVKENMSSQLDSLFQDILGRSPTEQERAMYTDSDWEDEDIKRYLSIVKLSYEYFGEVIPAVQGAFESDDDISDIMAKWQNDRSRWISNVVESHFLRDNASQDDESKEKEKMNKWKENATKMTATELLKRLEIRNAIWMSEVREAKDEDYDMWLKIGYSRAQLRIAILGGEKEAFVQPFRSLYGRYPRMEEINPKIGAIKDQKSIYDKLYYSDEYRNKTRHSLSLRTRSINNIFYQWLARYMTNLEQEQWNNWLSSNEVKAMVNTDVIPLVEEKVREGCGGNERIKTLFSSQVQVSIPNNVIENATIRELTIALIVRKKWTGKEETVSEWIKKLDQSMLSYKEMEDAVSKGQVAQTINQYEDAPLALNDIITLAVRNIQMEDVIKEVANDKSSFVLDFMNAYERLPTLREYQATLVSGDVSIFDRLLVGATPITTVKETAQYTGTVTWTNAQLGDRYFEARDAEVVRTVLSEDKKTATITITYPKLVDTKNSIDQNIVIQKPVPNNQPAQTIQNKDVELDGQIQWKTTTGSVHTGAFVKDTAYVAEFYVKVKGLGRGFHGLKAENGVYFKVADAKVQTEFDSDRSKSAKITVVFTNEPSSDQQIVELHDQQTTNKQKAAFEQEAIERMLTLMSPVIGQEVPKQFFNKDVELVNNIVWKNQDGTLSSNHKFVQSKQYTAEFTIKGKNNKTFHSIELESNQTIDQFDADKTYVAKIKLEPKAGYTLFGAEKDYFYVKGAYETMYDKQRQLITANFSSGLIDPPSNVSATIKTHSDKITVSWNEVPNATGYMLYRNDELIAELTKEKTTYDDFGAIPGKTNSYHLITKYNDKNSTKSAQTIGIRKAGPANVNNVWVEYNDGYTAELRQYPCGFLQGGTGGCWDWWVTGNYYTIRWTYPYESDDINKFVLYRQTVHNVHCNVGVDLQTVYNCFANQWTLEKDNIAPHERSTTVYFGGTGNDYAHRFMIMAVTKEGASFYFNVPEASVLSDPTKSPATTDIAPNAAVLKFPKNPIGVYDSRPHGDILTTNWVSGYDVNLQHMKPSSNREWRFRNYWDTTTLFLELEGTKFPIKLPLINTDLKLVGTYDDQYDESGKLYRNNTFSFRPPDFHGRMQISLKSAILQMIDASGKVINSLQSGHHCVNELDTENWFAKFFNRCSWTWREDVSVPIAAKWKVHLVYSSAAGDIEREQEIAPSKYVPPPPANDTSTYDGS